jgi:hypothetical protein
MFGKLASLKLVAHELGARYNILDNGPADPALDAPRTALSAIARRYARLDALAADYAVKIDAALAASSLFADALREQAASHVSAADADAEVDLDRVSASTGGQAHLNAAHAAIAALVTESGTAASLLDALANCGELQTLLAPYRSFIKEMLEVTIDPLGRTALPRVEKLKTVADYTAVRAAKAAQRSLANHVAPVPSVPQQHYQSSAPLSSASSTSSTSSASRRSRLRDRPLQPMAPSSSTVSMPAHQPLFYSPSSTPIALPMRQSEAEELQRTAEADRGAYTHARDSFAADVVQLQSKLVTESTQRIAALVVRIDNSLASLSNASNTRRQPVDTASRIGDFLMQSGDEDGGGDPSSVYLSQRRTTLVSMATGAGAKLPASPFPPVDWFELSDELKMLVSLKLSDADIVAMYPTCGSVSPAILDHNQIRCMTLRVPSHEAVECSPLQDTADPRLAQHRAEEAFGQQSAQSHLQYQYICVKGTNFRSLKHVLLDMDTSLVRDPLTGFAFHRGFYEAAYELHKHVIDKLRQELPVKIVGRKCVPCFSYPPVCFL